jgi:hypothetical protein
MAVSSDHDGKADGNNISFSVVLTPAAWPRN